MTRNEGVEGKMKDEDAKMKERRMATYLHFFCKQVKHILHINKSSLNHAKKEDSQFKSERHLHYAFKNSPSNVKHLGGNCVVSVAREYGSLLLSKELILKSILVPPDTEELAITQSN